MQQATKKLDTETGSQILPNSRAKSDSQIKAATAKKSGSRVRGTTSIKTASRLRPKHRGKTRLLQTRSSTQDVRETQQIVDPQTKLGSDNPMLSPSNIGKALGSKASQKLVPINSPIKVPVTKRKPKRPTVWTEDRLVKLLELTRRSNFLRGTYPRRRPHKLPNRPRSSRIDPPLGITIVGNKLRSVDSLL